MGLLAKPTASTPGLVLRFWPSGESSGIASLLTRDQGFVKLLAKSVRKPGSRLRALVEPGRLVQAEFSLDPNRELQYLRGGSVELDPLGCQPSLERTAFLLGALELIDRCRPLGPQAGHRAHKGLFEVCEEFVRVLSSPSCAGCDALFFAFEWELLERHGMAPVLDTCPGCGEMPVGPGGVCWFSPAEGGAVCGDCARHRATGAKPLSWMALEQMRSLAATDLATAASRSLDTAVRREIGAALHHFMGYHLPGYRLPAALDLLRATRPGGSEQKEEDVD
jgi:DNA repair protein RecO (recombination protein O)